MGNRAFITSEKKDLGIYLHWNGGRDSVNAFLKYCELRHFRSPEVDGYGWARLAQVVANFFGRQGLSIGIEKYTSDEDMTYMADNNGVYVIKDWEIVDRVYPWSGFEEQDVYDLGEMLVEIDDAQPEDHRLGHDFLDAEIVPAKDLRVNDTVFVTSLDGWHKQTVVEIGGERIVNGQNVRGLPMIDLYPSNDWVDARDNINNYLTEPTYRRAS